ncbi:MAG: hypothetical protein Q9211_006185 [Gyalolechia sp. 1 TL-2023]
MSFATPHVAFLKDLENYLPLGTLTLPSDGESVLGAHWDEYYPKAIHGSSARAKNEVRDIHKSVWALLCLGWLRTFARRHPQNHSLVQIRVYVLPSDVGGRYVERSVKDWEHVKKLIKYLDVSAEGWEGTEDLKRPKDDLFGHELRPEDNDSLFYIFNTLPSPRPSSVVSCPYSSHAISSLLDNTENVPGLQTELYAYQRRSAAAMIQREAQPTRTLDPRLDETNGPTGGKYLYDRTTGAIFRYARFYEEAKGGILAETMGLGKTLICLAAILATKGHWPQIPPQYPLEGRQLRPRVGSLMDMAAAAANQERIPWRSHFQRTSSQGDDFDNCRRVLEQNVPSYTIPAPETRRSRRPTTEQPGRVVGLCATTLVVVPLNLFSHWRNEIAAHVEEGNLNVFYADSNEVVMPSARELQLYDIILLTKARFEEEMSLTSSLKNRCTCTETVRCYCSAPSNVPYSSPLANLHFLRIIVDEGHDFSSFGRKNNAVFALQKLHVDRRWIVSGTPSSGLLGIEASTATLETLSRVGDRDSLLVKEILESRRSRGADMRLEPSVRKAAFVQERKDLEKLGSIVEDFLDLRPWANGKGGDDVASWKQYVLPNEHGQRKPHSLRKVLESLVIRHRLEDVETDIKLPPLYNRTVYLEPRWHDKLSLNLFIMNLAVNAVTSERTDQDYMFHPKNRASLNQLITNLRNSGFYWTAFTKEEVSKSIEVSGKYLQNKSASEVGKEGLDNLRDGDFDYLRRAIHMGETVLDCPSWRAFSTAHELGLYIDDFPEEARKDWSLTTHTPGEPLVTGAPQMSKAQSFIDTHLYASNPASGLDVLGKSTMDKLWQSVQTKPSKTRRDENNTVSALHSHQERRSAPVSTSIQKPRTMGKRTISRAKPSSSSRKTSSQDICEPRTNDQAAIPSIQPQRLKSALKSSATMQAIHPVEPSSILSKTRLSGTASAKLSYLLDRITVLHESEKILIFYEGDNIAFYIAQTLELLGIQFLIYTGSLSALRKNAYITTFNTTETFRILLMDVHQAAHGLHIAAASRVFFVNPVWQPTVEAQAIKRAHRIGQKRPVYVETLVLKDTLEDQMLRRRKNMSAQEHHKAEKSLLDDDVMEKVIKDADFIPLLPEERKNIRNQMAPLQNPQNLFGRLRAGVAHFHDPDKDLIFPQGMPLPSRKRKVGENGMIDANGSLGSKQVKVAFGI